MGPAGCSLILIVALLLPQAPQSKARVELGSDVTMVGGQARVGLTLDPGGEQVTAIEDDVVVPASLSFVKAELGDAGKAASLALNAEMADAAGAADSRSVRVKITAPEGAALPVGLLAVLIFTAPDDVEGESVDIRLSHHPIVTVGGERRDAPPQESGGMVTVMKKPLEVIACFFYMH